MVTDLASDSVAALECSMTIFLTIMFIVTLSHFLMKLKDFGIRKTLSAEKRSVRKQFYVFFFAFFTKGLYSGYWLVTTFISGLYISNFPTAVVQIILWVPWNIIPLSVVFYVHHKTFISANNRLSSDSSENNENDATEITIDKSAFMIDQPYDYRSPSHSQIST